MWPLDLFSRGDEKEVKRLLELGAEVNVQDNAGWTPLVSSSRCGPGYVRSAKRPSPQHEAAAEGFTVIVSLLLAAGANPDARGMDNSTPLHDAAGHGHLEVVKVARNGW